MPIGSARRYPGYAWRYRPITAATAPWQHKNGTSCDLGADWPFTCWRNWLLGTDHHRRYTFLMSSIQALRAYHVLIASSPAGAPAVRRLVFQPMIPVGDLRVLIVAGGHRYPHGDDECRPLPAW